MQTLNREKFNKNRYPTKIIPNHSLNITTHAIDIGLFTTMS